LSSSQRLSVVSAVPLDGAAPSDAEALARPESERVPAGTTAREDAAKLPVFTAAQRDAVIVSASRVAVLPPGEQMPGGARDVPEKRRSAARWISIALAVLVLAWTFLR
jgi:hypothetical protein